MQTAEKCDRFLEKLNLEPQEKKYLINHLPCSVVRYLRAKAEYKIKETEKFKYVYSTRVKYVFCFFFTKESKNETIIDIIASHSHSFDVYNQNNKINPIKNYIDFIANFIKCGDISEEEIVDRFNEYLATGKN